MCESGMGDIVRRVPTSDLETHYLGEPSARSPVLAFLLALASPGAGWAYVGRLGFGLLWNTTLVLLWAGFVLVWATRKFYPGTPLVAFFCGWYFLVFMSALDVFHTAKTRGPAYVLRESNHAIVYLAVILFSFAMPLAGLHHVTLQSLWSVTAVEDDAMYPTLVEGDRILVDRVTFDHRSPVAGELVTFQLDGEPERIARVMGVPGDVVIVAEDVIFVNDAPVVRRRLDDSATSAVEQIAGDSGPELSHFVEERGRLAYHITLPQTAFDATPDEWNLRPDQFLLLHDNRSRSGDSRRIGPISRTEITGRPVFVGFSDDDNGDPSLALRATGLIRSDAGFRAARLGRRVQPSPPRS